MPQLQLAPRLAAHSGAATTPRAEVHQRIAPFARTSSIQGYLSFAIDIALYAFGIAGVLMLDGIGWKIAGGLLAGSGLVNLGSLSHEAAHRVVVKSRLGNELISIVSFTMILFNYRLWVHDHHVLHHARTNVKNNNFLSPLTLAEYRAMSRFRRGLYRAYHSGSGLGILLYYLLERWPGVHFYPGSWLPKRFRPSAWLYTALETGYAAALLSVLVLVSSARNESVAAAVLLGFVMPYTIWFMVFSMTAFLQHTNPRLRWHRDVASVTSSPEATSVHVRVPGWLNHMTHYVLEHPVHHVSAKIPHYYLKKAQVVLARISEPPIIVMQFSIGNMRDVLRRCRLYDYDEHVWVDFNGNVTAVPDETVNMRQAAATVQPVDDRLPVSAAGQASPGIFFPADASADQAEAGAEAAVLDEDARL
jgi:acyl-lipid omega-6 desaturase (Delta-12 desaturase)